MVVEFSRMAASDVYFAFRELALQSWLLFLVTFVLFYYVLNRETRNIPPGPTGLPVVGYIPFLKTHSGHEQLFEFSKTYGPVFSIKLGPNNCIIINDYTSAIELMSHPATQERPSPNLITLFIGHDDNLLSWKGQLWNEHRKFILRNLRRVGVSKAEMETVVTGEIAYMLDKIAKDGQDGAHWVSVGDYLTPSASNVINAVITGKRYDYDHPVRVKQDGLFNRTEPAIPWTGYVANYCKFLMPFRSIPVGLNKFFAEADEVVVRYVSLEVEEQKAKYKYDESANLIASYLSHYDSKMEKGEATLTNPNRIPGLATNLIGAASGAVKDVIEWLFLHCAIFPDIQNKLIEEIEKVIGYDRKPKYADRHSMPYTQAFIWESMRHSTSVPLNLPHITSSDVTIGSYTIPKGYQVFINFWAINRDKNIWNEPDEFSVDRFLTPEGDKVVKHKAFMPFSTGRRSCPGEALAQVELFIYLVMTLQRYTIKPPDGVQLTLDCIMAGFSRVPRKLELVFANRK